MFKKSNQGIATLTIIGIVAGLIAAGSGGVLLHRHSVEVKNQQLQISPSVEVTSEPIPSEAMMPKDDISPSLSPFVSISPVVSPSSSMGENISPTLTVKPRILFSAPSLSPTPVTVTPSSVTPLPTQVVIPTPIITSEPTIIPTTTVSSKTGLTAEQISQKKLECQKIQNYIDNNACYGNLAIDANDPSICPDFGLSICKYFIFMWHTDLCNNIPISKPIFRYGNDQAEFQKLKEKQECIKKIAIDTKDAELCKNLFDEAADCQDTVAIMLNDPSKCSDYGDCVMKIAINKKDINICKIKYDKAWCIVQFPKLLQGSLTGQQYDSSCYLPPSNIETTGHYEIENQYKYPNTYDTGLNDYPTQIAPKSDFTHLLSIPFNKSNNLLRVYANSNNNGIGLIRLVKYSPSNGSSELLGDIRSKIGASWHGIYLPIAIAKDDNHIIFKAHMGSRGLGGGVVTLGYAYSSLASSDYDACGYIDPQKIANVVYLYDNFSKALFLTEENNVPASEKPGLDYLSAIKFLNIVTGETKTLLEEPNTIYEIINIDEQKGVVNFKSCPWQEYRFNCTSGGVSSQSRSINLP